LKKPGFTSDGGVGIFQPMRDLPAKKIDMHKVAAYAKRIGSPVMSLSWRIKS